MPDERKTVTALFADVVGSTAMGSERDPELVRDVLRQFFDRMRVVAQSHGGTVEKYIGDAVMVVFGMPRVHEDDAERAVRAALAMNAATAELEAELRVGLAIRLGVNTGEAVTGAGDTPQFLLTGDAINVGARLVAGAEAGEILVGERTRTLTGDAIEYGPARRIIAKGKAEPVLAHPVIRARTETPVQHRGLAPLHADLVGRDTELRVLLDAISAVTAEARPQLVTVLGQAGVGKSRLVGEALDRAGAKSSVRVLRGRCLPYGTESAYWAFGEVIRSDAGIVLDDDKPSARAKLDARVSELLPDLSQRAMVRARLAVLIGLEDRDAALPDVAKERIATELIRGLRRYLQAIASAENALVLILEDLQWGERPVLDAVEDLIDHPDAARILLVCLARPELVEVNPGWAGSRANARTLTLEPLTDRDIATLIARLLRIDNLTPELRDLIGKGSGGNPLFCEELLRMLIDDGTIVHQGDTWGSTTSTADIRIPDSVQSVLGARLDSLPPSEKLALQTASVLGEQFSLSILFGLHSPAELAPAPESLLRKGMFVEAPDGETLAFKHILIRDVAYGSLAKAERADLHERAVARLVDAAGDRTTEISEVLAYHAERAYSLTGGLTERHQQRTARARSAVERLATAADRAAGLYLNLKAAELYARAITIAAAEALTELLTSLYVRRGRALELLNDFVQAQANYEEMERRAGDLADEAMLLDALSRQATIHAVGTQQLDRSRSEALIDRGLEIARRRGDRRVEARLKWSHAHLAVWTGRLELAVQSADEAVAIARELDSREELAYALNILARGEAQLGRLDAGMAHWVEAAKLFEGLRNGPMLADTRVMIASLKVAAGDYEGALTAASDVYKLSEDSHNAWGQGMSRMTTANVQWERGEFGSALRSLEEAIRFGNAAKANWVDGAQLLLVMFRLTAGDRDSAFAELGGEAALTSLVSANSAPPLIVLVLAYSSFIRGDLGEADRLRAKASALAGPTQARAVIALVSAEIALANREYVNAAMIARDALADQRGQLLILESDLRWIEGDALLRAGDLRAASDALERSRAEAERRGSRRTLWLILWSLARLAAAEGRASDALDLRRRARAIVDAIADSLVPLGLAESFRRTPHVSALLAEIG